MSTPEERLAAFRAARDDLAARYDGTIWTAHDDMIDEYLA